MTYLEAINSCLTALGEARVTSDTTRNPTVDLIRGVLDAKRRELLEPGWWFNTVFEAKMYPGLDGTIEAPVEAFSIFGKTARLIERDGMLFDLTNNTKFFTGPQVLSYTYDMEHGNLPEAAANVVTFRAAIEVYTGDLGTDGNIETYQEQVVRNYQTMELLHLRNMAYNTKQRADWRRYRNALRG